MTIEQYFKKRLKELKLKETDNKIKTSTNEVASYQDVYFDIDKERNAIEIKYYTPDGRRLTYLNESKKERDFSRKRYMLPPEGKGKYWQPSKSGVQTYFTPELIDAYKTKKKIKILIVVEGEFKAFAISNILKIPAIGIGGIKNIRHKQNNTLEQYVLQVFEDLEIENVILLHDADALKVEYKEKKDLATRLNDFYWSAQTFAELCKPFDFNLYFGHILEKFNDTAKGIDDLLNLKGILKKNVYDEIQQLTAGNHSYFKFINLNINLYKLKEYFNLHSVTSFYEKYKKIIEDKEFIYLSKNYFYDGTKIVNDYYKHALSYLRVGTDYYKKQWVFDKKNMKLPKEKRKAVFRIEPWQIGEIKRDHGQNKRFLDMIPKYDGFINVPDNLNYQRIFEIEHEGITTKYYNRYFPVSHDLKPGEFPTIKKFLKHIFSDVNLQGETLYHFGLDYIKLTYEEPQLRLPVLCLVSNERNTGKSTFLEFLRLIFKENASILDNERFTSQFTSHFVDKLIVAVDEGFIPMEMRLMKERIKNFSTGKTQWLEGKGKDAKEIDNYCHLIMCSNDQTNFMQIDSGENRFAVLRVKPFEGKTNARMLNQLKEELPAFLNWLINDYKLTYKKYVSRFSFDTNIYETITLARVIEQTRPKWIQEIEDYIIEMFTITELNELHYSPTDLATEMKLRKINVAPTTIRDWLQDTYNYYPNYKVSRYDLYTIQNVQDYGNRLTNPEPDKKTGRSYALKREDFLKQNNIEI